MLHYLPETKGKQRFAWGMNVHVWMLRISFSARSGTSIRDEPIFAGLFD